MKMGVPKGALDSHTFPSKATLEKDESWSAIVRNAGDLGSIAFGIVNASGNPSKIVATWGGTEYIIELGYYLRISKADVPSNGTLSVNGTVRFSVAGTYSITLWAMHLEGSTWYYDQEIVKSVIAASPSPVLPEWWWVAAAGGGLAVITVGGVVARARAASAFAFPTHLTASSTNPWMR